MTRRIFDSADTPTQPLGLMSKAMASTVRNDHHSDQLRSLPIGSLAAVAIHWAHAAPHAWGQHAVVHGVGLFLKAPHLPHIRRFWSGSFSLFRMAATYSSTCCFHHLSQC